MKILRTVLLVLLVGMLAGRSGMFLVRLVREWRQPVSRWQPANPDEQMIWENFAQIDSGVNPE